MASSGANVESEFPALKVRFVGNHGDDITTPAEKFYIVAGPDDLLSFIVNFGDREH